jgi:hypothetical protein
VSFCVSDYANSLIVDSSVGNWPGNGSLAQPLRRCQPLLDCKVVSEMCVGPKFPPTEPTVQFENVFGTVARPPG